jgi:hypothetical protein
VTVMDPAPLAGSHLPRDWHGPSLGECCRTVCTASVPLIVLPLLQDRQTPADVACSGGAALAALRGEMEVLLDVGVHVSPAPTPRCLSACLPACSVDVDHRAPPLCAG